MRGKNPPELEVGEHQARHLILSQQGRQLLGIAHFGQLPVHLVGLLAVGVARARLKVQGDPQVRDLVLQFHLHGADDAHLPHPSFTLISVISHL